MVGSLKFPRQDTTVLHDGKRIFVQSLNVVVASLP